MKLEVIVSPKVKELSPGIQKELIKDLNQLNSTVLNEVLKQHLRVRDVELSELDAPGCEFAGGRKDKFFCRVWLTGIPVMDGLTVEYLNRARFELAHIYKEAISKDMPKGTQTSLQVSIAFETPLPVNDLTMIEFDETAMGGANIL